jgi:hypothetical protein
MFPAIAPSDTMEDLDLPGSHAERFREKGIDTFEDLADRTIAELRFLPHYGAKTLSALVQRMIYRSLQHPAPAGSPAPPRRDELERPLHERIGSTLGYLDERARTILTARRFADPQGRLPELAERFEISNMHAQQIDSRSASLVRSTLMSPSLQSAIDEHLPVPDGAMTVADLVARIPARGGPGPRPPRPPRRGGGGRARPVFLSRADGHSAVLDRVSLELAPLGHCYGVERDNRGHATGLVRREAMQIARRWFIAQLPAAQLSEARAAVASHLASLGVVCAHEMGGPDLMGLDDFDAWLDGDWPVEVVGYWGDLDVDVPAARNLRQVGGALHLDGTIGSHTAALEDDYADEPGRGHLYRGSGELVAFTTRAFQLGLQVADAVVGDRAVAHAVDVLDAGAARRGVAVVVAPRPGVY